MQKSFIPKLTIKDQSQTHKFSGFASVFNTSDSYNDIILPRAIQESLQRKSCDQIKLLWQHNIKKPIGVFATIEETVDGLYVEGSILTNFA